MDFNQFIEDLKKDVNDMFTQEDIDANKAIGAVATIPLLFWIPLVAAKDSAFAKFYANQGLLVLLYSLAVSVVTAVLAFIPFIGGLLGSLLGLTVTAVFLYLLISALQGKARRFPIFGEKLELIK